MHPIKCIKMHYMLITSKNVNHDEAYIIIDASICTLYLTHMTQTYDIAWTAIDLSTLIVEV